MPCMTSARSFPARRSPAWRRSPASPPTYAAAFSVAAAAPINAEIRHYAVDHPTETQGRLPRSDDFPVRRVRGLAVQREAEKADGAGDAHDVIADYLHEPGRPLSMKRLLNAEHRGIAVVRGTKTYL